MGPTARKRINKNQKLLRCFDSMGKVGKEPFL